MKRVRHHAPSHSWIFAQEAVGRCVVSGGEQHDSKRDGVRLLGPARQHHASGLGEFLQPYEVSQYGGAVACGPAALGVQSRNEAKDAEEVAG